MRRRLALLLAASCFAGCAQTVALRSAIRPSNPISGRSSEKAGVVCSEGLLGHVERASGGTLAPSYELELGEPLCNVLLGSVEGAYRAAQRASVPLYRGRYGRVVQFDLQNSALAIESRPDGSLRVTYTISVAVERLGRDLERLSRNVVTGNTLVDCPEVTDQVVQQAVEAALQQVADDTLSLLAARLDGPRVYDPSPERVPAAPQR